ncbi:MAG: glycosyl hydrolase [Mycobacterium sp.]
MDTFARDCADYGEPVYLRFGHEMNSDWYPWSVSANGGSPQAFIDAYRRLHDRFQAAGATNVRWVWCPNIIYRDRPDLIVESYPGDDVVDVIAVDGYNRGGRSPENVFAATFDVLNGISEEKPLWINEVGCTPGDGASAATGDGSEKAAWITDLFTFLDSTRVDCLLWFELQTATTPDWRLLATPETTDAAQRSLRTW